MMILIIRLIYYNATSPCFSIDSGHLRSDGMLIYSVLVIPEYVSAEIACQYRMNAQIA